MQFHHVGFESHRRIDLLRRGINKEADANPGRMQTFHRRSQFAFVPDEIESAFRCDLLALLGHEANFIGLQEKSEIDQLGRVAHLEIELRHDVGAQPFQIALLHMAAISPQMRGDPARPGALAETRRHDRIGFGILRIGRRRITHLPEGGDMIDVHAELQGSHQTSIGARRRERQM